MKTIKIGDESLFIKDYYCAQDGQSYVPKTDGKVWLYVNLTDMCPCSCPFCVNPGSKSGGIKISAAAFQKTLGLVKDYICGVSFTGGEPLLFPDLLDEAIQTAYEIMGPEVEIDLATSGIMPEKLLSLKALDHLYSIHISRHRVDDDENRHLMRAPTPSQQDLKKLLKEMCEPEKVVLNCILQKDGVHSLDGMADYLEMASQTGVRNVSFIGLIPANDYCREQFIHPAGLHPEEDERFRIWNKFHDHDCCSCSSGDYRAASGWVRFYYRVPGKSSAPYTRQLVYSADNELLAGFGGRKIDLAL